MALSPADRRRNRQLAKRLGYVDKNGDGVPDVDKLDREELAKEYKTAVGIIYSVPEIRPLFEEALSKGWSVDKFASAVQNSSWYQSNNEYSRMAWARETIGGADWQATQQTARAAVQQRATQLGASLTPAELDALTRRYLYEGWGDAGRQSFLDDALSGEISYLPDERGKSGFRGQAGNFTDQLGQLAFANGISFSDDWYQAAARSVAAGLTTEEDWLRDVREQAAGRWGAWGEQIRAGQNAYDLASPYINMMARELELSPYDIKLTDPYIDQAMNGGPEGAVPLWQFQQKLRNDPRWMDTNYAQNQVTGVAGAIARMFGAIGG